METQVGMNQMRTKNECPDGSTISPCANTGSPEGGGGHDQASSSIGLLREGSDCLRGGEGTASRDQPINKTLNLPLSDAARAILQTGAVQFVGQLFLKFPDGTIASPELRQEIAQFVNSMQTYANASAKAVIFTIFKINGLQIEGSENVQIH